MEVQLSSLPVGEQTEEIQVMSILRDTGGVWTYGGCNLSLKADSYYITHVVTYSYSKKPEPYLNSTLCVCVGGGMANVWRSNENFWKLILSFHTISGE